MSLIMPLIVAGLAFLSLYRKSFYHRYMMVTCLSISHRHLMMTCLSISISQVILSLCHLYTYHHVSIYRQYSYHIDTCIYISLYTYKIDTCIYVSPVFISYRYMYLYTSPMYMCIHLLLFQYTCAYICSYHIDTCIYIHHQCVCTCHQLPPQAHI